MHITDDKRPPAATRDAGAAVLILWIIVFAGFMVALMALDGGRHVQTAHHITAAQGLGRT